jgi:hypothetical protein
VSVSEHPGAIDAPESFSHANPHFSWLILAAHSDCRNLESGPEGEIAAHLFLRNLESCFAASRKSSGVLAKPFRHGGSTEDAVAAWAMETRIALFRDHYIEWGGIAIYISFRRSTALGEEMVKIDLTQGVAPSCAVRQSANVARQRWKTSAL